jgi:hypothetical protein
LGVGCGATEAATRSDGTRRVHSHHHQAVRDLFDIVLERRQMRPGEGLRGSVRLREDCPEGVLTASLVLVEIRTMSVEEAVRHEQELARGPIAAGTVCPFEIAIAESDPPGQVGRNGAIRWQLQVRWRRRGIGRGASYQTWITVLAPAC